MAESMLSKRAGNDALNANPNRFLYPQRSDINITTRGSDFYWAITAAMALSAFIFMGLSFRKPRHQRIFYYITASICLVASIAYFTMASNLGYAAIPVEFQRSNPKVAGVYREIFYVRYIDWVITTPLLLMDVLLTGGLPWPTVLYTILIDEIMIVTGLVGALVASSYKWGYFVFAMFALFFIFYNVVMVGRTYANHISPEVGRTYIICGAWTMFLWFIYPIAWGLCEGGNLISSDGEAVFYGILDLLAKPVFGALLIWGHRNIDPAVLGLHIRAYDEVPALPRDLEKSRHYDNSTAGVAHNNGGVVAGAPVHDSTATGTTGVAGTHANNTVV